VCVGMDVGVGVDVSVEVLGCSVDVGVGVVWCGVSVGVGVVVQKGA